jgi:type IV pilus assembly protein PilB
MPDKNRLGEILISWNLITPQDLEAALEEQKEKGGYLGQIFIDKGLVSSTDISRALQQLSSKEKDKAELGLMLIADKIISPEQLETALEKQKIFKKTLEDTLLELGFVTSEQIAQSSSRHLGLTFIKLSDYDINLEILELLPENIIRNYQVIPVKLEQNTLHVAISDPLNLLALDEIKRASKYQVKPMVAAKKEIQGIIERYFNLQQMTKQILSDIRIDKTFDDTTITRLVDKLIHAGINFRASDIHLEPHSPEMRVRFRIDGLLHDITTIPKDIEASLLSRIKVLADMDITEHRRPQDGHISLKFNEKDYDLRIASTSTIAGEKVVIRILDKTGMLLGLKELGLSVKDREVFKSLISRPYGIILVTGPTGAGKTTTLYAVLNQIDTLSKNVVTIEDPVEYKLEGINQTQVNPAADITFATGLRSILRQDPDIIMVGEIRDSETATIAIHAALTGHLVLSTLHTNDASSAITRLIDMGVEPFLVSSALIGVVAQRLVRTICPECKEQYQPPPEILKESGLENHQGKITFFRGRGCEYCMQTAYRGRTGVFEVMKISDKIRALILEKQPAAKIKEACLQEGMITLKDAALEKVGQGITTTEELKRAIFATES